MAATDKAKATRRAWYQKNKARVLQKVAEWQQANHPRYLAYQRQNRLDNLDARNAAARQWKATNHEKHLEGSRRYGREHKEEISAKRKTDRRTLKQTVLDAYGGTCACCGERAFEFLTLDHINGDGADHRRVLASRQSAVLYRHLIAASFPSGFRVLCFNCNSARGFYGYCPHHPEDIKPPNRGVRAATANPQAAESSPRIASRRQQATS